MELGHALLRATQDRNHLLPGEAALLTLEVAVDGKRVPFEVRGAELRQPSDAPGGRPESLASVPFLDDGVTPDAAAKDGIATARVSVPARRKSFDGKLQVRADVTTASEGGEVVFDMAATSAPPAIFTGVVRETIENGSLAFYAGIRVAVAGRYDFVGRVYDSQNRAMALLTANGSLDTSAREVRLNLCGQLLREANIAGPWELRDIEGLRFAEVTGDIERIPMPTWNGPHRTQVYPLEKFAGPASKKSEPQAP